MNSEEKILIDLYLKKIGREDLKCDRLYRRFYRFVKDILELPEWKDERFSNLLTSNIWNSNYDDIKNILTMPHPDQLYFPDKLIWDDERFAGLLTSNIWNSTYENIKNILTMKHPDQLNFPDKLIWDDERFAGLLTSSIWVTSYDNISVKVSLPVWSNPFYTHLLTPSIWTISTTKIEDAIKTFEELGLQKYITTSVLRRSSIQIKALCHYLIEHKIPIIKDDKLHSIFNVAPSLLKVKYGIDMKLLVAQETERMKLISAL